MTTQSNNTMQLKTFQSIVLCHFSTTAPATNALNRSASARAVSAAGADRNAARVYNTILTARGTAVGRAISLQQQTGVAIRRCGSLCPTGGIYLRIKDVTEVQNIFDDAQVELDTIREDILATYPSLLAALNTRLGSFATEVQIPTATEVASKFAMSLTVINQPVAVDGAVLVGLTEEVANRVRADSQRQVAEMLRASHAGPINDLKAVIAEFSDRLRNADRLHLSQFDKLRDEARRVQKLNFLELPEIEEVVLAIADVARIPDGSLTRDDRVRIAKKAEAASVKADETLAALGL
jgi:hypothetical protein